MRAIKTITANLRMLAEESPEPVSGSASGVVSPSQVIVVAFQFGVAPEQEQFGAVLPVPKQAVQDLSQLEEQVIQPSVQALQEVPSRFIPYPFIQEEHTAAALQTPQLATVHATQAPPIKPYPESQSAGVAKSAIQSFIPAGEEVQSVQVVPPTTGPFPSSH